MTNLIDVSKLTEDQICALADRIRIKRKFLAIYETFVAKDTVMIRWDIPNSSFKELGISYYGIQVPVAAVEEIVSRHFDALIHPKPPVNEEKTDV